MNSAEFRRRLDARAMSPRRFRSSLLRGEGLCGDAARLPTRLLHRGELCCRPPQSPLGVRDVRKRTPLAVGCRKSRARRSTRVGPARSNSRRHRQVPCATIRGQGNHLTRHASIGRVHSRFVPGLPPRPETAYDLPQFWVRLMPRGVSNGARGVAFSDLTFSRRVL